MIELWTCRMSTKRIMMFLNSSTTNYSTNPNIIFIEAIIYFSGLIQRVTIMENPNGYNLTYKCYNP